MNFLNIINGKIKEIFIQKGYDEKLGFILESNRPDLCDYQINSLFKLSKDLNKRPRDIFDNLSCDFKNIRISNIFVFDEVNFYEPGFINLLLSNEITDYFMYQILDSDNFLIDKISNKKVILDYGGANVAKPLHIGHLRSAVIGEGLKRLCAAVGDETISDVHLGDFGLQMGLVIEELIEEKKENDFNLTNLESAYPKASKKAKEVDENGNLINKDFNEKAHLYTKYLQEKREPYYSVWQKILKISKEDLKKNYERLNVFFDLWKGESDVYIYINDMTENMIKENIAYESDGALVVNVSKSDDKIEIPPCIIKKKDGSALYATTDLATIVEREKLYKPDKIIYIADKRQSLHFTQVFRVARKAKLVDENCELCYVGFGTMNGKDKKPFKTRDGGVLRLERLIDEITEKAKYKLSENKNDFDEDTVNDISKKIAIAALKYGDLSNQANKDYVFDIDKFISFEGNTGPYILYTIVRIKSILSKLNIDLDNYNPKKTVIDEKSKIINDIKLNIIKFNQVLKNSYNDMALNYLCKYIYDLSNSFNTFYHEYNIINEKDENKKNYFLNLSVITVKILLQSIDILGFDCPKKM